MKQYILLVLTFARRRPQACQTNKNTYAQRCTEKRLIIILWNQTHSRFMYILFSWTANEHPSIGFHRDDLCVRCNRAMPHFQVINISIMVLALLRVRANVPTEPQCYLIILNSICVLFFFFHSALPNILIRLSCRNDGARRWEAEIHTQNGGVYGDIDRLTNVASDKTRYTHLSCRCQSHWRPYPETAINNQQKAVP